MTIAILSVGLIVCAGGWFISSCRASALEIEAEEMSRELRNAREVERHCNCTIDALIEEWK